MNRHEQRDTPANAGGGIRPMGPFNEAASWLGKKIFTLIELLVVIAIIAILITILLPALKSAKTYAQRSASISNIKQLHLACSVYADASDGYVPFYNFSIKFMDDSTPLHVPWSLQLLNMDFISDKDIFWSPARRPNPDTSLWYMYTGYGLNQSAGPHRSQVENGISPIKLGSTGPPPAKMIMLAETWSGQWGVGDENYDGLYFVSPSRVGSDDGPSGDGTAVNPKLFCYGNTNVQAYLDGHCVPVEANEVGFEANGGGYRNGWWSKYTSISAFYYKEPWYTNWWAEP